MKAEGRGAKSRLVQAVIAVIGLSVGLGTAFAVRSQGSSEPESTPSIERFPFDTTVPRGNAVPTPAPTLETEPADPLAALASFLGAIADGTPEQAYPLLDTASRERFPTVESWVQAQADRLVPLTFSAGASSPVPGDPDAAVFEVTATHEPSLDAFRGLVPGRSSTRWKVRNDGGGWRVGADPVSFEPLLPGEETVPQTVRDWVTRQAACDGPGARSLQVEGRLLGPVDLTRAPCEDGGTWRVGEPVTLERAADSQAFLAAFGPNVASWARLVPVEGPDDGFLVAAAPLGDDWRVMGVATDLESQ